MNSNYKNRCRRGGEREYQMDSGTHTVRSLKLIVLINIFKALLLHINNTYKLFGGASIFQTNPAHNDMIVPVK